MGGVVPARSLDACWTHRAASCLEQPSSQKSRATRTVVTGADGQYVISNLPSGPVSHQPAFRIQDRAALTVYDQRPRQIDFQMALGGVEETVTVQAEAPLIDMRSAETSQTFSHDGRLHDSNNRTRDEVSRRQLEQRAQEPSANVQSLQRRAAGVLPVRIDVPRAGTSHRFLKPLVVDEETVGSSDIREAAEPDSSRTRLLRHQRHDRVAVGREDTS